MQTFFLPYALFAAKTLTFSVIVIFTFVILLALAAKHKLKDKRPLKIKKLHKKLHHMRKLLNQQLLPKKDLQKFLKETKEQEKTLSTSKSERLFVLDFQGDLRASAVAALREEITAILTVAEPRTDEVVLRLESSGGLMHAYGLAASELVRLRDHGLKLTVIIDKVAASGGYLMAAVATKILAAPFAIVGSIGVLAQLPNFHKLLKKHDIDFEEIMAGEFKRTLSLFGENTPEKRQKFQEEIFIAHELFKDFVSSQRPAVDIAKIATGEYWYGRKALELKLIDDLKTSDEYIFEKSQTAAIYEIHYTATQSLTAKLQKLALAAINLVHQQPYL